MEGCCWAGRRWAGRRWATWGPLLRTFAFSDCTGTVKSFRSNFPRSCCPVRTAQMQTAGLNSELCHNHLHAACITSSTRSYKRHISPSTRTVHLLYPRHNSRPTGFLLVFGKVLVLACRFWNRSVVETYLSPTPRRPAAACVPRRWVSSPVAVWHTDISHRAP